MSQNERTSIHASDTAHAQDELTLDKEALKDLSADQTDAQGVRGGAIPQRSLFVCISDGCDEIGSPHPGGDLK